MSGDIAYWRQGEATQNFGDFLASYLFDALFLPLSVEDGPVYLVGSVIADFLAPPKSEDAPAPTVFWGCGARDEAGLSADSAQNARILAVRGPLSASALRLGDAVPLGVPALFMPALHAPRWVALTAGKSVCIPHFWDERDDAEQRAMSGCEVVLRPNIPNARRRLLELVDAIVASRFVLTASLHGAVIAAAYGTPFGFWDNGHLDLPFKWKDFAASIGVQARFHRDLSEAQAAYGAEIAGRVRLPELWPLLERTPFPLRADAALRVLAYDLRRSSPDVADLVAARADGLALAADSDGAAARRLGDALVGARQAAKAATDAL